MRRAKQAGIAAATYPEPMKTKTADTMADMNWKMNESIDWGRSLSMSSRSWLNLFLCISSEARVSFLAWLLTG